MEIKSVDDRMKYGKTIILKKDWPPYSKGTKFKYNKSCSGDIIDSPSFGEIMSNGEKIPSFYVKTFYDYVSVFDSFGGFSEWFYIEPEREIKSWSSKCIEFEGKPITQDIIDKIKGII